MFLANICWPSVTYEQIDRVLSYTLERANTFSHMTAGLCRYPCSWGARSRTACCTLQGKNDGLQTGCCPTSLPLERCRWFSELLDHQEHLYSSPCYSACKINIFFINVFKRKQALFSLPKDFLCPGADHRLVDL